MFVAVCYPGDEATARARPTEQLEGGSHPTLGSHGTERELLAAWLSARGLLTSSCMRTGCCFLALFELECAAARWITIGLFWRGSFGGGVKGGTIGGCGKGGTLGGGGKGSALGGGGKCGTLGAGCND